MRDSADTRWEQQQKQSSRDAGLEGSLSDCAATTAVSEEDSGRSVLFSRQSSGKARSVTASSRKSTATERMILRQAQRTLVCLVSDIRWKILLERLAL